jgi:hypothetical protein
MKFSVGMASLVLITAVSCTAPEQHIYSSDAQSQLKISVLTEKNYRLAARDSTSITAIYYHMAVIPRGESMCRILINELKGKNIHFYKMNLMEFSQEGRNAFFADYIKGNRHPGLVFFKGGRVLDLIPGYTKSDDDARNLARKIDSQFLQSQLYQPGKI